MFLLRAVFKHTREECESKMSLGVVAVLLLNVMDVFSVGGGALLDRPYMVFHRMCVLCL